MQAAKEELATLQETERGAEHAGAFRKSMGKIFLWKHLYGWFCEVQSETLQLHAQLRVAEARSTTGLTNSQQPELPRLLRGQSQAC